MLAECNQQDAAGSSIGLTLYVQFWATDDGREKPVWNMYSVLQK